MKKTHILLFTAMVILTGACSKDEILTKQSKEKGTAPLLMATVEQTSTTKSGVIEENDYTLGEKFYWDHGDATTVFFRNPSMEQPSQYKKVNYAANVAKGVQSKSCTFQVTEGESVDNGKYTAYGFFPTSAWNMKPNYFNFLEAAIPAYQTQTEANSKHLGAYMLMKAENDVAVDGSSPIHLSYKHLASVIRFAVWNNSSNSKVKLVNVNTRLSSNKAVFATHAKLAHIDARTNNYRVTKIYNIGSELAFLSSGIKEGRSYYFQLKIENGDFVPIVGTAYTVGDYWPNSTNPEGIVFWIKPGSLGTQGKIVGLDEIYVSKWGPDMDEQAAGVTGIRSLTDGATATKSMIINYKSSSTFATDYPAFYHIYHSVNGSNENGVWYLPARDELKMLFAGYSGKIYESIVNWVTNEMPNYDSAGMHSSTLSIQHKSYCKKWYG